ncbi:choice-of-anchor Q domain-containing protein, partial [Planctomycetota bacterium]
NITDCNFEGNSAGRGGGIYSESGDPTLLNCEFRENFAGAYGGGMYNVTCNPNLTDCTFIDNSAASQAGGMRNYRSHPKLENCIFIGNSAVNHGGGMRNYESNPTLENCAFLSNSSNTSGGGMANNPQSSPTLINCLFSGNYVLLYGGGMYNTNQSNPILINCLFSGNYAEYSSGGLENDGNCNSVLINCTFSGNLTDGFGGGIGNFNSYTVLTNCILWGNTATNGPQIYNYVNSTVTVTNSDVQGGCPGAGNIDADPLFVDADGPDNTIGTNDDNLRLLPGSPCIDMGDYSVVTVGTDLDGNPRIINGTVDMGSYEGSHQGFLLSTESIIVPEGATADFTVALAQDPVGTVEVTVAFDSGDLDISVSSSMPLNFNADNYATPQLVTLAAAEDIDYWNETALITISSDTGLISGVTATEGDNKSVSNILHVDNDVSVPNPLGASWGDAFQYLQDALDLAANRSEVTEIRVAAGTYKPDEGNGFTLGDRDATFQLLNGVAVKGGYAGHGESSPDIRDFITYETVLSGNINTIWDHTDNSYHVVNGSRTDTTAIIDGFTIEDGHADGPSSVSYGNPVWNERGSGMIILYGRPTLNYCIFRDNFASGYGGAMYNRLSFSTLSHCEFYGNGTDGQGGAIRNYSGSPTLIQCLFENNLAASGGGMYNVNSSPILTYSNFESNSATNHGGGMFNDAGSHPTLTYCMFFDNSVGVRGGGMYNYGDPILSHCIFSYNSSGQQGGGIRNGNNSSPLLEDCHFNNNWSGTDGGGMANLESTAQLINCTFSNNGSKPGEWYTMNGGGMHNNQSDTTLNNCTFSDNTAIWGGGMQNYLSIPILTDCTFSGNLAKISLFPGDFSGNGGGMDNNESSPVLDNCRFSGNVAEGVGGGMHNFISNTALNNCSFSNNESETGGGMFNNDSNPTVFNCVFSGNMAGHNGGGMCNILSSPTVNNCTFIGNSAVWDAGGMINWMGGPVTLINCLFSGNTAERSGGMFMGEGCLTLMTNCTFANNSAPLGGNALTIESSNSLEPSTAVLDNCILWNGGGGREISSIDLFSTVTITYSNVQDGYPGVGNIGDNSNDNPLFVDADGPDDLMGTLDDNLRLWFGSPSMDSGNNAVVTENTDLDGNPRIVHDVVDMGAYETPPDADGDGVLDCEEPARIFVDTTATGLDNGSSWTDAHPELQTALAVAANSCGVVQEIWVAQGTYMPDYVLTDGTHNGDRTATFRLISGVAVYGGFSGIENPATFDLADRGFVTNETILSGDIGIPSDNTDNCYHIVTGSGTDLSAVIDGFTIEDGYANGPYEIYGVQVLYTSAGGMYNNTGSPTVSNCVFQNNYADAHGGAMYNRGQVINDITYPSNPELTNCSFFFNNSWNGGAIRNYNSSPKFFDCTFSNNSAQYGGGMFNSDSSSPELINCEFYGNESTVGEGGGMYNRTNSDAVLNGCIFNGNIASGPGGGIYNWNTATEVVLTNCQFIGNESLRGGGMYTGWSTVTLTNCLFIGNRASDQGGAMRNYYRNYRATITNCTFVGNFAGDVGGGIANGANTPGGLTTMTNSILWGNTSGIAFGEFAQIFDTSPLTIPPIINYSCIEGWTGYYGGMYNIGGDPQDDPQFIYSPLIGLDGNYHLCPTSPCINTGNNAVVTVSTDLEGNPRILYDIVDMGVYEFDSSFVTGGGWIYSPPGALAEYEFLAPDAEGKATFGFVAKYKKGANIPDGNTQFTFKNGGLNFHSNFYDWLVVAGQKAKFKGTGTIKDMDGEFKFMLTAVDGDDKDGYDRFRIKIWDAVTEEVVYDNKRGADDNAELDESTIIGGGSIVVHK